MSTRFWDLCCDVYLEIFRYFSVDQLFYSFYPDVLPSLFDILLKSRINLQLCLTDDDLLATTILSLIDPSQIISLYLPFGNIALNNFPRIQSITLKDVDVDDILLTQLAELPLFERLILLYSSDQSQLIQESLEYIFQLPFLKYLELDLKGGYLILQTVSSELCCPIEQFVLRTPCSWANLRALIVNLPCLRILRIMTDVSCTSGINRRTRSQNFPPPVPNVYLPSLQTVDLVWYSINLNDIIVFLQGMSNLKKLYLSGNMHPKNLQSKIWREILTNGCPNLKKLSVSILVWVQEGAEQVKSAFDEDIFFSEINFTLLQSTTESELLKLNGDFRR